MPFFGNMSLKPPIQIKNANKLLKFLCIIGKSARYTAHFKILLLFQLTKGIIPNVYLKNSYLMDYLSIFAQATNYFQ